MPNSEAAAANGASKRFLGWLGLSGVVVAADQLTKWFVVENLVYHERIAVLPFFSWVRWHNEGAAFSIMADADARWFFVALALAFSVFIIYELRRLPAGSRLMGWVYGLILGGAIGNGLDRLFSGYVVDFVLVHWGEWSFPAFNVADSALSIGAALWIGSMIVDYLKARGAGGNDGEQRVVE